MAQPLFSQNDVAPPIPPGLGSSSMMGAAAPSGAGNLPDDAAPPIPPGLGGASPNAPTPTSGAPKPPRVVQSLGAGALEGVHDVTDWPAQELANAAGAAAHAVGIAPNWHPGASTAAADQANAAAYQQKYGNNLPAAAGRLASDIAGSTAELAGGESAIGDIGNAAVKGVPGVGADMAKAIGRFVAGDTKGNLIGRGLSKATYGTLQGAAAADAVQGNQGPTIDAAEKGAIIGGSLAPVAAVAGAGLGLAGKAARSVWGSIADTPAGTNAAAAREILAHIAKDGMNPADVIAAYRAMGPDATLADVGGNNLKLYAEGLANKPGAAGEIARSVYENRADSAEDRVTQAVKDVTGQQGNTGQIGDDLMAARKKAADPLYQKAFASPPVWNDELAALLDRPAIAAAYRNAKVIAGNEGYSLPKVFDTDEDGQITGVKQIPDLKTWDYIKRGLGDVVQAAKNPITGKIETDAGRAVEGLRREMVAKLDDAYPDYAPARAAYSGPSESLDAQEMGRRILKDDPYETAKTVANLSPSDKAFYLNGAAKSLIDTAENNPQATSDARTLFGRTSVQKKLQAALGSQDAWSDFQQRMEREIQFADNKNRFLRGSQSARRLSSIGAQNNMLGHIWTAVRGDPLGAALGAAREAGSAALGPTERQETAAGKMLFYPGAADEVEAQFEKAKPGSARKVISGTMKGFGAAAVPGAGAAVGSMVRPAPNASGFATFSAPYGGEQ